MKRVIRITVKRATNGKYDMKELNEAEPVRREGKTTDARDVFGIRRTCSDAIEISTA